MDKDGHRRAEKHKTSILGNRPAPYHLYNIHCCSILSLLEILFSFVLNSLSYTGPDLKTKGNFLRQR